LWGLTKQCAKVLYESLKDGLNSPVQIKYAGVAKEKQMKTPNSTV
jgi:hypothetical protein